MEIPLLIILILGSAFPAGTPLQGDVVPEEVAEEVTEGEVEAGA